MFYARMMWQALRARFGDEKGQGMVEYGLIIALVALALVAILIAMSGSLRATFQDVIDCLANPAQC